MKAKLLMLISLVSLIIGNSNSVLHADSNVVNEGILAKFLVANKDNHRKYVITENVDLQDGCLKLSSNTQLVIKKGIICNGSIIGDSTILDVEHFPVFDNIKLGGTWKISEISTDLFQTSDENSASNLTALSSDKLYNKIIINKDIKIPIKPWDSYLILKSNTDLILNADIYTLPTELKGGYGINVKGSNIRVQGNNHYLFGTLASSEQKECFQWLHGLNIAKESSDVKVENLNSWMFCGDGFYNGGSNVTFDKVTAKFNGRQGLSITNGHNITVKNSLFTLTGYYRICICKGPGAGIDIEPNKDDVVDNILIDNCKIVNNYRYMRGYVNDLEIYNARCANISVTNSEIGGVYLGSCSGVSFSNCIGINTIYGVNTDVSKIDFVNCGKPFISNNIKDLIK